jgi:hypothetical protein
MEATEHPDALAGPWGVDDQGRPVHLPSYSRGIETQKREGSAIIRYRLTFPKTGLPTIVEGAEHLSSLVQRGMTLAPDIWSQAVIEESTVSTVSSTYSPWIVAVCKPDQYRHLGPWTWLPEYSDVKECQTCKSQIGK